MCLSVTRYPIFEFLMVFDFIPGTDIIIRYHSSVCGGENRDKMNLKIFIVLLHCLFMTIPLSQNVLANTLDVNETQSKIRKISTITTTSTIVSETCNDRFCHSPINDTANGSDAVAPSYKEYDQLKTTSILYGVARIATQQPQPNQCYKELNQIYAGIHRKEIWAIKGK